MIIKEKGFASDEPPLLICDLNGIIIFANNRALNNLYPTKVGDSVSKYVDIDYIKKLSILENRLDVIVPLNCKYKKLVIQPIGTGITKTLELSFVNTEDENSDIIEDKKLFATFGEMIGQNVVGLVKLEDFVRLIVDCIHEDLRFAYRKFEFKEDTQISDLYTNFSHLCTLTIATIMMLNEIEYRNPIEIDIKEIMGEHILTISIRKNTFENASGLYELTELFPNAAMRLMYVAAFSNSVGIKYDFSVKPNKIETTFVISKMINDTGKFCHSVLGADKKAFVSYVIGLFANDITEEEQE